MDYFLTLVAAEDGGLKDRHVALAREMTSAGADNWIAPGRAADLGLGAPLPRAMVEALWGVFAADRIDIFTGPAAHRRKTLLLADMDATIVRGETLDDLAAAAGCVEPVAAITARGMRGELDFAESLRQRMELLRGVREDLLAKVRAATILNDGAATLTATMAKGGATCVLVSGGATYFTADVASRAGFHHHHGNTFDIRDGVMTGAVLEPLLDRNAKLNHLRDYAARLGVGLEDTLAIGDGANDLPMLQAAGLGIGYHPKPLVRQAMDNCIFHGDLTAALFAQGYVAAEISS